MKFYGISSFDVKLNVFNCLHLLFRKPDAKSSSLVSLCIVTFFSNKYDFSILYDGTSFRRLFCDIGFEYSLLFKFFSNDLLKGFQPYQIFSNRSFLGVS